MSQHSKHRGLWAPAPSLTELPPLRELGAAELTDEQTELLAERLTELAELGEVAPPTEQVAPGRIDEAEETLMVRSLEHFELLMAAEDLPIEPEAPSGAAPEAAPDPSLWGPTLVPAGPAPRPVTRAPRPRAPQPTVAVVHKPSPPSPAPTISRRPSAAPPRPRTPSRAGLKRLLAAVAVFIGATALSAAGTLWLVALLRG